MKTEGCHASLAHKDKCSAKKLMIKFSEDRMAASMPSEFNKPISEWTTSTVVEWMTMSDGMINLVDNFKSQKICGATLLQLKEEMLDSMGITDDCHKQSLMDGIRKLRIQAESDSEGSSTESDECTSDISEHSVKETNLTNAQKCDKCSKLLKGPGIIQCAACGLSLHRKCMYGKVQPCNSDKFELRCRGFNPAAYMGLVDLSSQVESSKYKTVPDLLYICTQEIERRAQDKTVDIMLAYKNKDVSTESIYLLKRQLLEAADKGDMFDMTVSDVDLPVLGGFVKKYLRELSEPLIPTSFYQQFIETAKIENQEKSMEKMNNLLDAIPEYHNTTLDFLLSHLCRLLSSCAGQSLKLAQVFCHIIMRPEWCDLSDLVENTQYHLVIIQRLFLMQNNNNYTSTHHNESIEMGACADRVPPLMSEIMQSNDKELLLQLDQCLWYWGEASREEVHDRMTDVEDGSFLVRNATSHSTNGDFTLVLRKGGANLLIKILHRNGAYGFAEPCDFKSVQALVLHYKRNSLEEYNSKLNIRLQHPVQKEQYILPSPEPSSLLDQLKHLQVEHVEKSKNMDAKLSEQKQLSHNMQHLYQALDTFVELSKIFDEQIQAHRCRFGDSSDSHIPNLDGLHKQLAGIKKNKENLECKIQEGSEKSRTLLAEVNSVRHEIKSLNKHSEQIISQLLRHGMSRKEVDEILSSNASLLVECPHRDEKTWFVKCSRNETLKQLSDKADGTFLIRPGSQDNPYTLSIVFKGRIEHCKIFESPTHQYGFADQYFNYSNLTELVLHYRENSLSLHNRALDICLTFPVNAL